MMTMHTESSRLFFGPEGQGVARYDKPRWPIFDKLNDHMWSLFWLPQAVTMAGERRAFNAMDPNDQFVYTAGLQRAIMLDTFQGRAPTQVFGPHVTDSSLENCITTWQAFETIHSKSYTHILRAVYPNPSAVVDEIPRIKAIQDSATSISDAYMRMIQNPTKENLYLALIEANALESLRFFVFFSTLFNLKKQRKVPASGDIGKLIARDENVHLSLVNHILKALPKDDPEFADVMDQCKDKALAIYDRTASQEKEWVYGYLFSRGPILGQTPDMIAEFIDRQALKSTNAAGLTNKPLPKLNFTYMDEYIEGAAKIQGAPQEDGATEYLAAASLDNDLEEFVPILEVPDFGAYFTQDGVA